MDLETAVDLVKDRLGIRSNVRDTYITSITNAVVTELEEEKGLAIDLANPYHLMFVVDYATWRYQSRDSDGAMPRHLQYRLHNLMIHAGGGTA